MIEEYRSGWTLVCTKYWTLKIAACIPSSTQSQLCFFKHDHDLSLTLTKLNRTLTIKVTCPKMLQGVAGHVVLTAGPRIRKRSSPQCPFSCCSGPFDNKHHLQQQMDFAQMLWNLYFYLVGFQSSFLTLLNSKIVKNVTKSKISRLLNMI